ncbi:MAG: YfhO family protein [Paludibacteraceae bacterium]|nr:YfhO family protein [Paludibacteraceae bacterium]
MKTFDWKKLVPDAVILLVFVVAAMIYFWPAVQGQIIYAGDNINGTAAVHEGRVWNDTHPDDATWWTGSMFSGMPNYQIGGSPSYQVDRILKPVRQFFTWGLRNTALIFVFYLCAFFLLFRSFRVNKWVSMAGAFATALSSYFFVIIAAQHHGKCYSITWMMLVIVGFILTYRKQYGWGALLIMFFTYIGFFLHPQMSYYMCMLIGMLWFAELSIAIRDKAWKHFCIATVVFFASFGVGMGMGSGNIFANQEYAEQTMRGGHSDLAKDSDTSNKTGGLDLDYATAWSYGIPETMTLLIPNYMGGASGYDLGEGSLLEKEMKKAGVPARSAKQFCQGAPTYWGEKAFTSGPVYMGAIICFLFLLGLLIVKTPYKWALLAATLFSVALAWGHNMMWLTELFFSYFPMYNKFRAVESILVVAEITMPLLAMLAIKQLADSRNDQIAAVWNKKAVLIAGGVTVAICLFVALFGGGFDVTSSYDASWKGQVGDLYDLILKQRREMMTADAWRSLLFVVLAAVLTYWYAADQKMTEAKRSLVMGTVLTLLVVADMWPVDKRFCNDSNFVTVKERDKTYQMQPYEQQLLQDTSHFRVLNLTANTFNDARTSYYLKSVGGYSAAKLRRYQDLIDEHISKEMSKVLREETPVLNMLNTKYFIGNTAQGVQAFENPFAMGNCWLVNELKAVDNANAESNALLTLDLRQVAVYDQTYEANAHITDRPEWTTLQAFDEEKIELLSYAPNKMVYHSQVETPRTAVFSEIYYPYGWKATVDGQEVDIYRVNYMLRAITLPGGEHEVVFVFDPDSIRKGNGMAMICFGIFLLTFVAVGVYEIRKKRNCSKK